jgi:hypothetical protein
MATAAEIWGFPLSGGLTADAALTGANLTSRELHMIHGLQGPLVVTPTSRTVGAIVQTISEAGGVITVERLP